MKTIEEVAELNERNIRQALDDYACHTSQTEVLNDVSDVFIRTLAKDSAQAKASLRELFRKSPVWDEELQALVINGTRTHNPDYANIARIGYTILRPAVSSGHLSYSDLDDITTFFSQPNAAPAVQAGCIEVIDRVAPKAYSPSKKLSRVFKAICQAVGVVDESAGSDFQRLYAQFADELSSKRITFKLYVSINPAHFITMSNPKADDRGSTLTSCHSFNSTEYPYNCGCAGYARDEVSIIAFTAADPRDPETLNNRKTTRQIFAYEPGNGVLMQSRLYNTSGGTHGAQEESKLYRDLIQRELSALEDIPNLWKTGPYLGKYEQCVRAGRGFGGYRDWTYDGFEGKVSIHVDHEEGFKPLEVGTYGLCICCGHEIDEKLYCWDCSEGGEVCDECGCRCGETYHVYDRHGNNLYVCEDCRYNDFTFCEYCEEYYPNSYMTVIYNGNYVCEDCLNRHYEQCGCCSEYYPDNRVYSAIDALGNEIDACEDCLDSDFSRCDHCGGYVHNDLMNDVIGPSTGVLVSVCPSCKEEHYSDWLEEETA